MATALVFAGNSFLGKPLCEALRQRGLRVTATTRKDPSPPSSVLCDLTHATQLESLIERERPALVIQCAGATQTHDPAAMYELHVGGTLAVLSAVARHVPTAVVLLFGSAAEYGPMQAENLPISERCPTCPATPFGASKLAQTHLAQAAALQWQLRIVTVRPFNVIGPGLPDHYFAASLARRLLTMRASGEPCSFPVTNLHATRDFVDVRDVADALVLLALDAPPPAGAMDLYNIATGVESPLSAVATALGALAGGFYPVDGGDSDSRGGATRSCGDASRLRQRTGWSPGRTWQQSVADMWNSLANG